jgi:hypothetical protein
LAHTGTWPTGRTRSVDTPTICPDAKKVVTVAEEKRLAALEVRYCHELLDDERQVLRDEIKRLRG